MKTGSTSLIALFLIQIIVFAQNSKLAEQVLIRRTEYGVPHIKGENFKAVAFGLAYAEIEDYGKRVITPLIRARGDLAKFEGYEAIDSDFIFQQSYQRTVDTYFLLNQDTRDLLGGFAEGINFYLNKFPGKFPEYKEIRFNGYDVAAASTRIATASTAWRFLNRLEEKKALEDSLAVLQEEGSNAWAFAPSRTKSGNAILVRNPHLRWNAGYYEAQITVERKLNFYGDFRIGGLFAIIGGFNDHLGWATTNNRPDLNEIYSLQIDAEKPDHYLFDDVSVPIKRQLITAEFKNGEGLSLETREFLTTPLGPVVYRGDGKIIVLKQAGDGEFRRGQQFVRMMMAKNLEEWKSAMRMQAITSSNYTYADDQGNIFYIWNASIPDLPNPSGKDTSAVEVSNSSQVWKRPHYFDQLPQLLNPKGGYLHNENDPFHFTNLNEVINPNQYPDNFPEPRLRQRSQHSLELIHNDQKFSLEDVVNLKHSMRMLVADQLKDELLNHIRSSNPEKEVMEAVDHLTVWDNSVRAESRGGVLFQNWFHKYAEARGDEELFATPWSFEKPMDTPTGLADPELAVTVFKMALEDTKSKFGSWNLAWGDVHRLRRGDLDLPASGCTGALGCFRVLWYEDTDDGKRQAIGGDGWQIIVEFSNPPKAYSILAYGQTPDEDSPHHTDQLELFANSEMKKVAFTEKDINESIVSEYRPGQEVDNLDNRKKRKRK